MTSHPTKTLPAPLDPRGYVPLLRWRVTSAGKAPAVAPGAVPTGEGSRMLHMIVNRHNAENCAFRGEQEAELLVGAIDRFQQSAPEHGLTLQAAWANRAAHEIFLPRRASHAHAIEDPLLDAGVVGRTHSRIMPIVATEQAGAAAAAASEEKPQMNSNESQNVRLVEELYAAADSDPEGFLARLAPDVQWIYPPVDGIAWAREWHGHDGVARWAELHNRDEEVLELAPEEFVAQGHLVVVLGQVSMRTIATGREWATRFAHAITVRDGLVGRYEAIFDTAACVRAHELGAVGPN